MNRSEIRKIGGSTIAGILNLSPWSSPHGVYLELTGDALPKADNEAMERGRKLEPVVAAMFAAIHEEFLVDEVGMITCLDYPFLIASPDRQLLDREMCQECVSGLEIKTADVSKMSEWGDEEGEGIQIPLHYWLQCQWYSGLLGLPDWYLAVGFVKPGSRKIVGYKEYHIEHDPVSFSAMKQAAIAFWENHVVPRVPPEITEPDIATVEYYKRRERVPEKEIFADDVVDAMVKAVMHRQSQLKEAEKYFELEKTRLIARMGDAEIVLDPFTKKKLVSFKGHETSSVDYKGLIAELDIGDELIDRFRRKTQVRTFRLGKM